MYDVAKLQYQIAHVTGALSMFGSAWILTEILLDHKKIRMTYHWILFGLSFFDFFSSFGFFLGNWAQFPSKDGDFGLLVVLISMEGVLSQLATYQVSLFFLVP